MQTTKQITRNILTHINLKLIRDYIGTQEPNSNNKKQTDILSKTHVFKWKLLSFPELSYGVETKKNRNQESQFFHLIKH